jgi:hypothetical protein
VSSPGAHLRWLDGDDPRLATTVEDVMAVVARGHDRRDPTLGLNGAGMQDEALRLKGILEAAEAAGRVLTEEEEIAYEDLDAVDTRGRAW